jgi:hypothetical protein
MQSIQIKHALYGPWWYGNEQREGPPPPGLLHGDQWNEETGDIKRGAHGVIVGIVDFVARTRYGFSSRGVPQYLFHPADPRWPPMIVGSKASPTANQWGLVSTKDLVWQVSKSRWPQVSLQRLLGEVGETEVEVQALRWRYLRPVPRTKHDSESASLKGTEDSEEEVRFPDAWDTVFNVDPAGCRDVDDCFAWRYAEDLMEFAIGIADVASLVTEGSPVDEKARLMGQTLYCEGAVAEPMLPTSLSESRGSLLADGRPRRVLALIWCLRLRDGVWTTEGAPRWQCQEWVTQRAFTYESVLADTTISNMLPRLLAATCSGAWGRLTAVEAADPHRWVEVAMVTYNAAAAGFLRTAGTGILRRHAAAAAATTQTTDIAECPEIKFLGWSAGEYVSAGEGGDVAHAGLGLQEYCHVTSPLRRYADLVNQRALKDVLGMQERRVVPVESTVAMWLNERAREAKAYERDHWCLTHLSATTISKANAWVIGWKTAATNKNEIRLRCWVPEWRRIVKVPMAPLEERTAGEVAAVRVGKRGIGGEGCWVHTGASVEVAAFWDIRNTPEHRFVFTLLQETPA